MTDMHRHEPADYEGLSANCPKCNGTGRYAYDENHSTICDACCPHDEGWWLLKKHYGERNGLYCCKRGCGSTREPEELGVIVPAIIPQGGLTVATTMLAAERERCARVAENYRPAKRRSPLDAISANIATAIRSLKP